ncbi:PQQ-binding-like beta-propeller repeat protein [Kribbella sp. NPDC056345]|uniref:outer membrane protein assembly factor BamB family protein n=1 Tax=Kribbella sp. NPDC056345 TaxID=3345789 RepID=UPI0035DE95AA
MSKLDIDEGTARLPLGARIAARLLPLLVILTLAFLPWLVVGQGSDYGREQFFRGFQLLGADQPLSVRGATVWAMISLFLAGLCLLLPGTRVAVVGSLAGVVTAVAYPLNLWNDSPDDYSDSGWLLGPKIAVALWLTNAVVTAIGRFVLRRRNAVPRTSRRRVALATVIAIALTSAVPVAYAGWNRWAERCSAQFEATPAEVLRTIHADPVAGIDLSPADEDRQTTYRSERARAMLTAVGKPGGGFRPATRVIVTAAAGRAPDSVNPIGTVNGDPILAVGAPSWLGADLNGSLVALDRTTGLVRWGREYSGNGVHASQLPGQMMMLKLTPRPMAAAFTMTDGGRQWCTSLGKDPIYDSRAIFKTDTTEQDKQLYVVRGQADEADSESVRLTKVDATSGKISWERSVQGIRHVSSIDTFGDQVLFSQVPPENYAADWNSQTRPRTPDAGILVARSAATGDPAWTFAGPDDSSWAVNVIGISGNTVIVAARQSNKTPANGAEHVQSWLIALDPTGKERWRQDLGSALAFDLTDEAKVAGDVVLTEQRAAERDPIRLVARDTATGKVLWTRLGGTAQAPNLHLEESAIVDHHLVAAAYGPNYGIRSLDLRTGKEATVLPEGRVGSIVGDDKSITFTTESLVITLDHN